MHRSHGSMHTSTKSMYDPAESMDGSTALVNATDVSMDYSYETMRTSDGNAPGANAPMEAASG